MTDLFDDGPDFVVMDAKTRAHLYHAPHVHDTDGTCVRNRYRVPCNAPQEKTDDHQHDQH